MISIRRARPGDLDFLVELLNHDEVDPFLAAGRDTSREALAEELARSEREPKAFGRYVVEADGEPAGAMRFERSNVRSRIARLGSLAIHPAFRGRRLADEAARLFQRHLVHELGFHRLELEIYGFNERAIAHAERSGFVREGVKRRAYWRDGRWVDGVLFAILADEVENEQLP